MALEGGGEGAGALGAGAWGGGKGWGRWYVGNRGVGSAAAQSSMQGACHSPLSSPLTRLDGHLVVHATPLSFTYHHSSTQLHRTRQATPPHTHPP